MRSTQANPFYATRAETVALARRRYFDDGIPPAGVVSEAVFQSWTRCQRLHDGPGRNVEFQPVTQSRAQLALHRNRTLLEAWQAEVTNLQSLLGRTSCAAMLTDGSGVMIGATCSGRPHERLMPVATRVGVNLSEEAVGTTAPGIVVRTGQAVCVLGSEHFFDHVRQMHCAAAPIHDATGCLAGVLDISSESIEFGFDAAAMVGYLASAIENRLLIAQSAEHLILRIQMAPPLLDSSTVGLVGIRKDGKVAWVNGVASSLLGVNGTACHQELPAAEELLGSSFGRIASIPRQGAAVLSLPNGLSLWARSELHGPGHATDRLQVSMLSSSKQADLATSDTLPKAGPPGRGDSAPPPPAIEPERSELPSVRPQTVKTTHQDLLQRTLSECGGNLSEAARRLGVSRGWIYRRSHGASRGE